MKPFFSALLLAMLVNCALAQCLTDFTKLLPEVSLDYTERYDRVAVYGDYMTVGVYESDSLARKGGIAYVYQKLSGHWRKIATLAPSDPMDDLRFGLGVQMSQDYILVASATKVYLFKKPLPGWTSQTQTTTFVIPGSRSLGFGYHFNNAMAISKDQQTIALTDLFYQSTPQGPNGVIFLYHKKPGDEWNSSMRTATIIPPNNDAADFGIAGINIVGDRVITGTPFANTGNGALYVFRDPSGEFAHPALEAKLTAKSSAETAWLGFNNIVCTDDGIFAMIVTDFNATQGKVVIAFFEKPQSGDWQSADYSCTFNYNNPSTPEPRITASLATNGDYIIASTRSMNDTGYSAKISKGVSGWCDPIIESIDVHDLAPGQLTSSYSQLNAVSSNGDVIVGVVSHPDNIQANLALKVLSQDGSAGPWESEILSSNRQSTTGHSFGDAVLGFEDYLFVGSPGDGTVKASGGVVYSYKKQGTTWQKTGKITAPIRGRYDDVFGTALATNGVDLAVGAIGFEEHGRVFIYRKKAADWSQVEIVQEIRLPEHILTVFSYGDNVAMDDEWLLIPYVQNDPARSMVAIYRHDGTQWNYFQAIEIGLTLSRYTTLAVDIEGETIMAGNLIIEWNSFTQQWERRYILSPSDPEPIQIAPDFSHWITNGSMFGHQVDISGNTIFISAPTKDDGSTWDVGAIYVYTKNPGESWSSRTETSKILPRVRNERELFGYSMKILGNTLVAGAPGADTRRDGFARNKPGRAYVFQTLDYYWQEVTPVLDITGDSFIKDYFGLKVSLDETHFIISAPSEDIVTGKLSGSVYVTPIPPTLKLHPPVCVETKQIQLFGYPFGGKWSGPGIIDAFAGIVDVKVAGVGDHEYTYLTESCPRPGRMKVTIRNTFSAAIAGPPERVVCEETAPLNLTLNAAPKNESYNYLWYYRASNTEPFFPLNHTGSDYVATERGEYQVRVTDDAVCISFSPPVSINNEQIDINLTPLNPFCEDPATPVPLIASPAGGIWVGTGVGNNKFSTIGIPDGTVTLSYEYKSALNCTFQESMQVVIEKVPTPTISRRSGHLCFDGEVWLETVSLKPNVEYIWEGASTDNPSVVEVGSDVRQVNVRKRGEYWLRALKGSCETKSNIITITDDTFSVEISPANQPACFGNTSELWIISAPRATYQWYRAESADAIGVPLFGVTGRSFNTSESGFYYALVTSWTCEIQSDSREVIIYAEETIFIPNVFSPNGDQLNEEFTIDTSMDVVNLEIFNRYGKRIYSGQSTHWNGGDAPSGIYYWTASVRSCDHRVETYKGWVHLIR